jgi:hypothetical protein
MDGLLLQRISSDNAKFSVTFESTNLDLGSLSKVLVSMARSGPKIDFRVVTNHSGFATLTFDLNLDERTFEAVVPVGGGELQAVKGTYDILTSPGDSLTLVVDADTTVGKYACRIGLDNDWTPVDNVPRLVTFSSTRLRYQIRNVSMTRHFFNLFFRSSPAFFLPAQAAVKPRPRSPLATLDRCFLLTLGPGTSTTSCLRGSLRSRSPATNPL